MNWPDLKFPPINLYSIGAVIQNSGVYVRVARDGKFKSVLLEELSIDEFTVYLDSLPNKEDSRNWAIFLFRYAFTKE